jgi:hypothetical protein
VTVETGGCQQPAATFAPGPVQVRQLEPGLYDGMVVTGVATQPTDALVFFDQTDWSADLALHPGMNTAVFEYRWLCFVTAGGTGDHKGFCQDGASGLSTMTAQTISGPPATITLDSFAPGSKDRIHFRVQQNSESTVELRAVSVDGVMARFRFVLP